MKKLPFDARAAVIGLAMLAVCGATACNTVKGAGQDIQGAGEAVQGAAQDTQQQMQDPPKR